MDLQLMRESSFLVFWIVFALFSPQARAVYLDDLKAIKRQIGCYKVKFQFTEAIVEENLANSEFSPRKKYEDEVIELVTLDRDEPNEVSLVHTLVIGKGPFPIMKHWRQTWTLNAKTIWEYQTNYSWRKRQLSEEESTQWVQKISRIDDGPNRECIGQWIHSESSSEWRCSALSPIFRRDYDRSHQFDYNFHSHHSIFGGGYGDRSFYLGETIEKRKGNSEEYLPVVTEFGGGFYSSDLSSSEQEACRNGLIWWENHQKAWQEVEIAWLQLFEESKMISLKKKSRKASENVKVWRNLWKKLYRYASPPENLLARFILPAASNKELTDLIKEDWVFE